MVEQRFADTEEVADFAAGLSESFLLCRELGHNWKNFNAAWDETDHVFKRTLRCTRCKTMRHQLLTYNGHVISSHYEYADGYATKGFGRIVGEGRDRLRLEAILRLVKRTEGEHR